MKHIFIINPVSGVSNPQAVLKPKIRAAAEKLGAEYEIHLTKYPGHAIELAREYAQSGEPVRLYACGGDGTLNEVMQGARGYNNASTGCVPCGSGNDFVRNFEPKEAFLDLEDLMQGESRMIDVIQTQYGIASAICSAGLDAQVAYGIPKFRRIPGMGGEMAYKLSILTSLCSHLGHKLRVTADDEVFEDEYLMMALCNGQTYGGGFKASPIADMQDGLMDLVMVKKISRLRIAGVVNTYKKGEHIKDGKVIPEVADVLTFRRAKKISIEVLDGRPIVVTQDGECAPRMRVDAEIKPGAVQVLLPKSYCERVPDHSPVAVKG